MKSNIPFDMSRLLVDWVKAHWRSALQVICVYLIYVSILILAFPKYKGSSDAVALAATVWTVLVYKRISGKSIS